MIPMRTSSVFKSRWMALIWAAGFIWFALDVAGRSESSATSAEANSQTIIADNLVDSSATNEDEQKAAGALGL